MVGCPQCGTPIQPTWDWCEACGFDPENLKPAGWRPPVATHERPATAPRPAAPPPNWSAPPPGAQPAGRTTSGAYQPGGFVPPPFAAPPGGPYAPGVYGAPPPAGRSSGGTVVRILLAIGVAFVLLLVVLVGAVTLLGKNASSKFSRIETAIDTPNPTPVTAPAALAWQPYTPPGGSFTIDFPAAPFALPFTPADGLVAGSEARALSGNATYDAGAVEFTAAIAPTNVAALTGALEGGAKGLKLNVTSTKTTVFAGITSVEATLASLPGQPVQAGTARAFIVGKRLFIAFAFSSDGSHDFVRFADSLRAT